jgi:hypothetical protein
MQVHAMYSRGRAYSEPLHAQGQVETSGSPSVSCSCWAPKEGGKCYWWDAESGGQRRLVCAPGFFRPSGRPDIKLKSRKSGDRKDLMSGRPTGDIPYCPWQFCVQPFSRPALDAKLSGFCQGLACISWPGREIRLARERRRVRLGTTHWKRFLAHPALMRPRNRTHKLTYSSASTMAEPEAAPALKRKAGFDFKSWRLPIASASEPATAQPAPSPPTTAAGRDVVVIESLNDDEVLQQGQSRSQGRGRR